MSHRSKARLIDQVNQILTAKFTGPEGGFGRKRHTDKRTGADRDRIYTARTYQAYNRHCHYFTDWCRRTYHCRTLAECRPHADEWLSLRARTCSASTVSLERAALAKLFGETGVREAFAKTPVRHRRDVTRSRYRVANDRHFSERKNRDLVTFLQGTGLRRFEAERVRGTDFWQDRQGRWFVHVKGKGGKFRDAPVVGNVTRIVQLAKLAGDRKVWGRLHSACDVHGYRRQYAQTVYRLHAKSLSYCQRHAFYNPQRYNGRGYPPGGWERNRVYRLRDELSHYWLDRGAMLEVSRALGHNRISVVAESYLTPEKMNQAGSEW